MEKILEDELTRLQGSITDWNYESEYQTNYHSRNRSSKKCKIWKYCSQFIVGFRKFLSISS